MKRIIIFLVLICSFFNLNYVNSESYIQVIVKNDVTGYRGFNIETQIVELKLDSTCNAIFNNVNEGDEITSWFSNIPLDLMAFVDEISQDCVVVSMVGHIDKDESIGTRDIELLIPNGYVKYLVNEEYIDYEGDIFIFNSDLAKYHIKEFKKLDEEYELIKTGD